jgi:hypothetical protein
MKRSLKCKAEINEIANYEKVFEMEDRNKQLKE